jgi:hypothetical protein
VVLTHDLEGEYGHPRHKLTAEHALICIKQAGNPEFYPDSVAEYGTWNVAKGYIHLYPDKQVTMDWYELIPSMGNRSALDIAKQAFRAHRSQYVKGRHRVSTSGRTNCLLYGLVHTLVGDDTKPDFLNNFSPKTLIPLNPHYYGIAVIRWASLLITGFAGGMDVL